LDALNREGLGSRAAVVTSNRSAGPLIDNAWKREAEARAALDRLPAEGWSVEIEAAVLAAEARADAV